MLANIETATERALKDPFVVHEGIKSKWVKEWMRKKQEVITENLPSVFFPIARPNFMS